MSLKAYHAKVVEKKQKTVSNEIRIGNVAEWLKAPHSKCGIGETLSRVQISPFPQKLFSRFEPDINVFECFDCISNGNIVLMVAAIGAIAGSPEPFNAGTLCCWIDNNCS